MSCKYYINGVESKLYTELYGYMDNTAPEKKSTEAVYKILKAKIDKQSATIGEVIDEQMTIACGENSINIIEIQKEGKNPQLIKEFLLGNKLRKGTIIKSE